MASRYTLNQVDVRIVQTLPKESPATIFYLNQSYNLGVAVGELVGMGCNPDEIRQAFELILSEAVKNRKPLG